MKLEDFAFRVVLRTFELLERTYHYKVAEETKKEIAEKIRAELDEFIR